MRNEVQTRKVKGRLGRDVQAKLGKTLQAYFDDVVKEGVPDRFKELLDQFNGREEGGRSEEKEEADGEKYREDKGPPS